MENKIRTELSQKTISSVSWSVASKFFRQFLQLFFQIVLARMLSPEDFGLLSMLFVFTTLADILRNMGFASALIQNQSATENHYSTIFWLNVFLGITLNILFQLIAPAIADFYKQPQLENVTRIYSLIFLIGSFNIVQEALLQKELQFKRLFLMDSVSILMGGAVAIVLAINGFGIWTLVYQYLTIATVNTFILWYTSTWKPKFIILKSSFKELKKFGFNLLGYDLLSFVSRNADNLLIGKFIGAQALGIYSRAYFLMLQPINITNQVLARVMFPVLSTLQSDKVEIKTLYLKSTRMVGFVIFPIIAFVLIAAQPLIVTLLGNQWIAVARILQIFCIYCILDTIGVTATWIYKALGRTDILFKWSLYSTFITLLSIIIGIKWGIEGVAIGITSSYLIFLWIPGWYLAFKLIDLSVNKMLQNLGPSFLCSFITGGILYIINKFIHSFSPFFQCLTLFFFCLIIYLCSSYFINHKPVSFFIKLFNKKCTELYNKFYKPGN